MGLSRPGLTSVLCVALGIWGFQQQVRPRAASGVSGGPGRGRQILCSRKAQVRPRTFTYPLMNASRVNTARGSSSPAPWGMGCFRLAAIPACAPSAHSTCPALCVPPSCRPAEQHGHTPSCSSVNSDRRSHTSAPRRLLLCQCLALAVLDHPLQQQLSAIPCSLAGCWHRMRLAAGLGAAQTR